jgi:hypothetical protein
MVILSVSTSAFWSHSDAIFDLRKVLISIISRIVLSLSWISLFLSEVAFALKVVLLAPVVIICRVVIAVIT